MFLFDGGLRKADSGQKDFLAFTKQFDSKIADWINSHPDQ